MLLPLLAAGGAPLRAQVMPQQPYGDTVVVGVEQAFTLALDRAPGLQAARERTKSADARLTRSS